MREGKQREYRQSFDCRNSESYSALALERRG
jgi:hypothetical protein